MKRRVILSKTLVLEHCQTMPNSVFTIDEISRSLKADGIKGFSRIAITGQLSSLSRAGKITRVSMGRYRRCKADSKTIFQIDAEMLSHAEIGRGIVAFIELLKQENKELKDRLGKHEVVNMRDLLSK